MLQAAGAAPDEAALVGAHVVHAEVRASRSQGLVRVPAHVRWAREGVIRSGAALTVKKDSGSVLVLDAHGGWGHVAAMRAIDYCLQRASETGACLAVARAANHIGRLGYMSSRPQRPA
jgi:LDH2 family malate/lactate/ureidoglycolate dehydrogenase